MDVPKHGMGDVMLALGSAPRDLFMTLELILLSTYITVIILDFRLKFGNTSRVL